MTALVIGSFGLTDDRLFDLRWKDPFDLCLEQQVGDGIARSLKVAVELSFRVVALFDLVEFLFNFLVGVTFTPSSLAWPWAHSAAMRKESASLLSAA